MALADDFMVLSLGSADGTSLIGNLQLESGLAAAVLLELVNTGRVKVAEDGGVTLRDATRLGLAQEDAALGRIAAEDVHDLQWWINSLRAGQAERILDRLIADGTVLDQHMRKLGILSTVRHPPADPAVGRALRARMTAAIAGADDARGLTLLVLAHATTLTSVLFPDTDPKLIDGRVAQLATVSDATAAVIRSVMVAMITVLAAVQAAL